MGEAHRKPLGILNLKKIDYILKTKRRIRLNKSTFTVLFLFSLTLLTKLHSQWLPDIRLTNDTNVSQTSHSNSWAIAANVNNVHIVWWDYRDGNYEIYYKRSSDNGNTWGLDTRLTFNDSASISPSIAVTGNIIHVVWYDYRDGNAEIYYRRSTDDGITWGADIRLTSNPAYSGIPSFSVSGNIVNIVWDERRDGHAEIYSKISTNSGISWSNDIRITYNNPIVQFPNISINDMSAHVVYFDYRLGDYEIYYNRSTDGGLNWGTELRLTSTNGNSRFPNIAAVGSNVHVVWVEERDGNEEIYHRRSTDNGLTWVSLKRLTNNSFASQTPKVKVDGQFVHVVWLDKRDGNNEIYYLRSLDAGMTWDSEIRLTNDASSSYNSSISITGTEAHVVWTDERDGNQEIYYKKNPTANPIGIIPISNEIPGNFELMQNFPNPFNPITNINFSLPASGHVKLVINDILGKEVEVLVDEVINAGIYSVNWNAINNTSGIYFYRIITTEYSDVKKMILLK